MYIKYMNQEVDICHPPSAIYKVINLSCAMTIFPSCASKDEFEKTRTCIHWDTYLFIPDLTALSCTYNVF